MTKFPGTACTMAGLAFILFFSGCSDVGEGWFTKYLADKKEVKAVIEELKKENINSFTAFTDQRTGYFCVEFREPATSRVRALFYFDPKTKRCFKRNLTDKSLEEIY